MGLPKVSVGMPVYNGVASVAGAIQSVLAQSFSDFELVISDNASTDRTEEVCRIFAEKDARIRYVRQPRNIGAEDNFLFVLTAARAPFFMWAAADDIRSPDFIERNFEFLVRNDDYVASTMRTRFVGGQFDSLQMGDRALASNSAETRMLDFFSGWHANGAFYSLFRKDVLRQCPWLGGRFLGGDWAVILYLASKGKLNRLDQGGVELGRDGVSNSGHIFSRYRSGKIEYVLPFYQLTRAVFKLSAGLSVLCRVKLFFLCMKMNFLALSAQLHGAAYRWYKSLAR